jgi:radical SAM enzyme (rSAM/lipoprotein system)
MRAGGPGLRNRVASLLLGVQGRLRASLHDLTYLFWECTLRCDLQCLHCGSDCTAAPGSPDMPLPLFLGVLDEISRTTSPGRITVCLTGGEPALRPDLQDCIREISRRGFPVGMVTNGWSLTPERLSALAVAGLGAMTVSLDGLKESHDRLRGRKGSFERACRTIAAASRSSVLSDVVTCVHPGNLDELPEVMGLLCRLGVSRWRLAPIFPRGRAAGNGLLKLDRDGLVRTLELIREARKTGTMHVSFGCEGYLGEEWEGAVRDYRFQCRAGIDIGSVLADGSISGCPSLRGDFAQGSILTDGFMEVWENRFGAMRDRRWARTEPCASCRAWGACLGGPLHLRDGSSGSLMGCHFQTLDGADRPPGLDPGAIPVNHQRDREVT